jgi:hypothetical protein
MFDDDDQAHYGHPDYDQTANPDRDPVITDADTSGAGKLFAGKYKTAEDLENAYRNLESKLGAQGQELGSMRQQWEAMQQAINPHRQLSPEEAQAQMLQHYEQNPIGFIQQFGQGIMQEVLTQTQQQIAAQAVVNSWLGDNPEYRTDKRQAGLKYFLDNAVNVDPNLRYLSPYKRLDKARELLDGFIQEEMALRDKTRTQAEAEVKKMAAMDTGQSAGPPGKSGESDMSHEAYMESRRKFSDQIRTPVK